MFFFPVWSLHTAPSNNRQDPVQVDLDTAAWQEGVTTLQLSQWLPTIVSKLVEAPDDRPIGLAKYVIPVRPPWKSARRSEQQQAASLQAAV